MWKNNSGATTLEKQNPRLMCMPLATIRKLYLMIISKETALQFENFSCTAMTQCKKILCNLHHHSDILVWRFRCEFKEMLIWPSFS